jgi:CheY-like chemotaxis protein
MPSPHVMPFKILVAEDTADIRKLIALQLKMLGYTVLEAADGIEAVELAKHAEPDLILMDLNMPRMNGFDAARKIKAVQSLRKAKIIALSALPRDENREKALAAGCDDFAEKSLNFDGLDALVSRALSAN